MPTRSQTRRCRAIWKWRWAFWNRTCGNATKRFLIRPWPRTIWRAKWARSICFINPNGFTPNVSSLMNVSYVYAKNGQPLNRDADIRQNQTNLFYDPRPPVFVVTNITNGASEFRFYLDLNRNGRFDTNGVQRIFDTNGVITPATALLVGDPEWVGILDDPA